jgi:hypothetical protein
MTQLLRRFRGLAIALAVLAISAGAAFAAAPRVHLASAPVAQSDPTAAPTAEPTETPDEDGNEAEPTETPEATEAPEATDSPEATGAPTDTHGAMVSEAARMVTPEGFANHGAFVSCVAHLDTTVDLATVTPETCAAADAAKAADKAGKGADKAAAGKAKGADGKAHGHGHGHGRPTGG